jgi:large subunit ribosomal protein L29
MKSSELRGKSAAELKGLVAELLRERFNLQMQKALGQLSKPDRIQKVRRDVARVYQVLAEKELVR